MGKRFVKVNDADRRALRLHHQIKAVESLPLIYVWFPDDGRTIVVAEDRKEGSSRTFSVDAFLMLDVEQAKNKGGTWESLVLSIKHPKPKVSQAEID